MIAQANSITIPLGTIRTSKGIYSGLWALQRPNTKHWGSGMLLKRIAAIWGRPSAIFGKQDQVDGLTIDSDESVRPSVVADWAALPFASNSLPSGYWDPPYLGYIGVDDDVHYSRLEHCRREISRVISEHLLILSPLVYPNLKGWKRTAVIAITYGPNKVIRCLQGYEREPMQAALMDLPLFQELT